MFVVATLKDKMNSLPVPFHSNLATFIFLVIGAISGNIIFSVFLYWYADQSILNHNNLKFDPDNEIIWMCSDRFASSSIVMFPGYWQALQNTSPLYLSSQERDRQRDVPDAPQCTLNNVAMSVLTRLEWKKREWGLNPIHVFAIGYPFYHASIVTVSNSGHNLKLRSFIYVHPFYAAANTVIWFIFLYILMFFYKLQRCQRWKCRGCCINCGYSRHGIARRGCPECGWGRVGGEGKVS